MIRSHRYLLVLVAVLCAAFAVPRIASAYATMIRHQYAGCNQCHADPSGGGLLTTYGRAQAELLMRTRYGTEVDEEEPGPVADFLFGAFRSPEPLLLGGDIRGLFMGTKAEGQNLATRAFLMQADFAAQLSSDRYRVNASIGIAKEGALAASVSRGDVRLVSRTFWVAADLGEDRDIVVRLGRMNVPFGLRTVEHTSWVRAETRTDINAAQQMGLAIAHASPSFRFEAMGIAGNLQIAPDVFRERGYSGYFEWAPSSPLALGLSSLVTHAARDVIAQKPMWRHAHGAFLRWSPLAAIVLMAEADMILASTPTDSAWGHAEWLQIDVEIMRGLHAMLTAETRQKDAKVDGLSTGGWLSFAWFFAPHADIRMDFMLHRNDRRGSVAHVTHVLAQLHVFL